MQTRTPRLAASPAGVAAAAVTFLLLVLFSPVVAAPFWSPRVPILLALAGVAPVLLVLLWRSGVDRRPVVAAAVFLAVAVVSTLASDDVVAATTGLYGWGTGLVFVSAAVGAWALGRTTVPDDSRLLVRAFIAGVLLNAAVAVLQTAVDLGISELELFDGRAGGLVGNPVQLGAVSVAGFAVAAWHLGAHGSRSWRWLSVALLTATAVELSGSRFALGVAVVVVVGYGLARRLRAAGFLALTLAAGLASGAILASEGGGPDAAPGTERVVATPASGITPRVETWLGGWHALEDRPVFGAGPGRFRAATSEYRTLELVRSQGSDTLFVDAHNLFVEYAVTTGVLGVAALVTWLGLSLVGARGPLLHASLAVFALHLVQPQGVEVTPLALLALGAAVPTGPLLLPARAVRLAAGGLAALGLSAGAVLVYGDFRLDQAGLDFQLDDVRAADDVMPWWPQPADMRARIHAFEGVITDDDAELARALAWEVEAADRDPSNPLWWNRAGEIALRLQRFDDGAAHFAEALRRDPWSVRAMAGYARAAIARGEHHEAVHVLQRALLVRPSSETLGDLLKTAEGGG